jgi:tetratricopeptide (TPR) repeat protein
MAFVRFFVDWNADDAEHECRAAVERNPNAGAPRGMLAAFLAARRKFETALTEAAEAMRVEPVSTLVGYYATFTRVFAGQYEEACREGEALVELDPHLAQSQFVLAIAQSSTGRHEQAIATSQRAMELSNGWSRAVSSLGATYAAAGQIDKAREMLRSLETQSKGNYVSPLDFAFITAQLGEHEAACEWLERAYVEHHPLMMFINVYPWLNPLHPLPRFQKLVREMKLT